jgi:uncharacterized membrane protein
MYDIALFVHLVGVALLISGLAISLVSLFRMTSARDITGVRAAALPGRLIAILMPVAMLLILVAGLYMVSQAKKNDEDFGWSSGWVQVAIAAFVIMLVVGPAVNGRRSEHLAKVAFAAPDGPITAEVDAARRDPVLHMAEGYGSAQVVSFLFLMTTKPGLLTSVLVAVVLGAIGIAIGLRTSKLAAQAPGVITS